MDREEAMEVLIQLGEYELGNMLNYGPPSEKTIREAIRILATPAPERPEASTDLYVACSIADWQQVVGNGGPPCFHLDGARFCLRAKAWHGHADRDDYPYHRYVSLLHLIDSLRPMKDDGIVQPGAEKDDGDG